MTITKKAIRIYLFPSDEKRLREKALNSGYEGRGALSHYLEKLAREDIVFLSTDVKTILKLIKSK